MIKIWNWLYSHNNGFAVWVDSQKKHAVKVAAAKYYDRKPKTVVPQTPVV